MLYVLIRRRLRRVDVITMFRPFEVMCLSVEGFVDRIVEVGNVCGMRLYRPKRAGSFGRWRVL